MATTASYSADVRSTLSSCRTNSDESDVSIASVRTTDTVLTIPSDEEDEGRQEKGTRARRSGSWTSQRSSSQPSPVHSGEARLNGGAEQVAEGSSDGLQRPPSSSTDPQEESEDAPGSSSDTLSRRDSWIQLSFTFLGITSENWKGLLLFHAALSLLIHAYELSIATYSAFWGCPTGHIDDKMDKLEQKVLQSVQSSTATTTNHTLVELAELKKWEAFNKWVMSCAAYAVRRLSSRAPDNSYTDDISCS